MESIPVLYINLDRRSDRRAHVEEQLSQVGFHNVHRVSGIVPRQSGPSAIGCSLSHIHCLEHGLHAGWEQWIVVEDDIWFQDMAAFRSQWTAWTQRHGDHHAFDVLLLAGNVVPPYDPVDDTCIQVRACQTTTGYLVTRTYAPILLANMKQGVVNLMRAPQLHKLYAIDKFWFSLQRQHRWYLLTPITVCQRPDYSDIERRPVDYVRVMTDVDKPWLQLRN